MRTTGGLTIVLQGRRGLMHPLDCVSLSARTHMAPASEGSPQQTV